MCLDVYLDRVDETTPSKHPLACAQNNPGEWGRSFPYFVCFKWCASTIMLSFLLNFTHRHVLVPVLYFASACLFYFPSRLTKSEARIEQFSTLS